ncbi:efflux RND transporter periplasmic adaptor subunit [Pollutibacter soli]|uniref:efflux RND transporter periplasmic adaptor subunit n=1 Tax=Pollutibacter soli TaxID=3034157 RepID=UPI0030137F25
MKWFFSAAMLVLCACNRKSKELIRPVVQNITESAYASGIVKSRNQYEVFSKVNGLIEKTSVTEGDTVHAGDIIMTLADEVSKLSSENARIAASYSSTSANADRLSQLKINIAVALAKKQNDSALLSRQQNLWKEGIGSRNELEQRELAWKNSSEAYEAALLQYNNLKKEIDFAAQQSVKNLQISNALSNDYTIKSRQNGKVYKILKEPGEMVNPQTPLAIIGDVNEFVIKLQVDEYDIGNIKPGQKVFLSMDSYRGQVFEAAVSGIQPIMNDRSRSFEVEAIFTSRPATLFPNLTVEANILITTKENAMTIPRAYLMDGDYVLLKNGEKRKVVTGLKDYQRVEIVNGLSKDDEIQKPL